MRFSKETLVAAVAVAGCAGFAMNADAAALGTDLVVDGGFEDVSATTGAYGALQLNSWSDGTSLGFTYASGQYDNGGPLAGGGDRYFTSNQDNVAGDVDAAGEVSQLIDVSTGDTATEIAAGTGGYSASAFFTTYDADGDFGEVHLDFLDAGGGSLGTASFGPAGNDGTWTQYADNGLVPVGTATIQVSVLGNAVNGGPDGYIDNVTLQIDNVPEPGSLTLLGLGGLAILRRRRG